MTSELTRPRRAAGAIAQIAMITLTLAFLVLGDVLAFNQIATQSATDAIVQVMVFSIGGAGFVEFIRQAVFGPTIKERLFALVPGAVSVAALIGWKLQFPVGWSIMVTAIAAVALATVVVRKLWSPSTERDGDATQLLGLLCLAQTTVFVYVAVLATADASSNLFG
ncbi:MAG: hypothetical protein NT081_00735 [Actinobacteria bacterium]|nr:hypothetical protein [Actinomycetota bacterium]